MKTSDAEAPQEAESSSTDDKSGEVAEANSVESSDSEQGEASNSGAKSTDDFEKLFFDSLVQGVREALSGQEQKQTHTSGDYRLVRSYNIVLQNVLGLCL